MSKPSAFEVTALTEKLGRYKQADTYQIAAEFIQAEGRAAHSEIQTYFV